IATAPEGARVCLVELTWAGVHPGGWAPPDPCQPQRIVVRLVFYCRAVCCDRAAVEGVPWPGRPRGGAQLGGRSPGLGLAAAVLPAGGRRTARGARPCPKPRAPRSPAPLGPRLDTRSLRVGFAASAGRTQPAAPGRVPVACG